MNNTLEIKENIPDLVNVPENVLLAITHHESYQEAAKNLIVNLNGKKLRDWFIDHAYFCLPLTIANEHGFILKAAFDFSAIWNGDECPEAVKIFHDGPQPAYQQIKPHFGMGTITIETPWIIRTPKGVNTLIMNPPNYYIDGIIHMSACVETDNLRRNFTFNLKITRPNFLIEIKKDTPIGYMLPYPRHFIDKYQLKVDEEVLSKEVINNERKTGYLFGRERSEIDAYSNKRRIGKRYMNGVDIYGNKFKDHQKSLKCPFGFGSK
jgi:hypothetical protein